jgi:hypothetical protein
VLPAPERGVSGVSPSILDWWSSGLIQGFLSVGSGLSFLAFLQECGFRSLSALFLCLHLWNSGGPNWIKEWQLFSEEESKSWKVVSRHRNKSVSFADIVRKPALSGANFVPLGHPASSGPSSSSLRQRSSVFNRFSYTMYPSNDRLGFRPNYSSSSSKNSVVNLRWGGRGFSGRSQIQNYSNSSNGRIEGLNNQASLSDSCARPWAPRKLIWRPKKILGQRPLPLGEAGQAFGTNNVALFGPVVWDFRHFLGLSISGNNMQIFVISGQNCGRSFDSFPSKFENAIWVSSSRLWFRSPLLSLTSGPSPLPHYKCFGEIVLAVLSRSGSSPSMELALFTKPSPILLLWKSPSPPRSLLRVVRSSPLRVALQEVCEEMAFHRVDPAPFLPHGFVAQQVDHREIMVRTVTRPQPTTHEDWGIVLVQPLPKHEVNFHIFDDIIREYLVGFRYV